MKLYLTPIYGSMSWTTAQGSSCKDKRNARKYTDRKRCRRKFSHLTTATKFPTRRSLSCLSWFSLRHSWWKNHFHIGNVNLVIQNGTRKFYAPVKLSKQQSITMTFILSLIEILLLKFSPRNCFLKKNYCIFLSNLWGCRAEFFSFTQYCCLQ